MSRRPPLRSPPVTPPGVLLAALLAAGLASFLAPARAGAEDRPLTPAIAVDPTSLDFGVVLVGHCEERIFEVLNIGDPGSTLNVTHFTIDANGTSIVDAPSTPFGVPEGESVPITVRMCAIGAGPHEGTVAVHADNAPNSPATVTVSILANAIPICDAGGPYPGEFGQPIQLDGSGSHDPGGTIVSYAWEFGDGATGSGVMPVHVYAGGGQFTVTLCVTDDLARTECCATAALIDGPQPPVCDAGGPYSGVLDDPVPFDGSGSYTPQGTITSYVWEFGDGATGTGAMPTHVYTTTGVFPVTLCVVSDGQIEVCCQTEASISVSLPPVCDHGGPYAGLSGMPLQFDASGSYDPDGSIVSYAWTFGDGSTGSGPAPAHTYSPAEPQVYVVDLCVTDDSGLQVCCTTAASIGIAGGANGSTTFVMHAVETASGPCGIPDPCPYETLVNVEAGMTVAAYLLVRNYNDVAGLQTAFDFGGFEFLSGIWDCRTQQVNARVPAPPGGATDGTLTTAFDCIAGGASAVIGRLHMVAHDACLEHVDSSYPFGSHVVNCLGEIAAVPSERRGRICVGGGGYSTCELLTPLRPATWGAIKAQYR